jgi:hypothetical protein
MNNIRDILCKTFGIPEELLFRKNIEREYLFIKKTKIIRL